MNNKPEGLTMAEMDNALCELLPGTQYMDPPDGGSVTPIEQVARMVEDYRQRIAELEAQLAELAAQEPVAWMTVRENDAIFPRLHKEESQADFWVDYCNVGTSIIKHPLYTRAAQPAPLTVTLPQGTGWCSDPYNHGRNNGISESADALRDACTAAGIKLQIEGE